MRRREWIATVMVALMGGSIDLGACGDKFMRAGRSQRLQRYGAVYPGTILIYSPADSTRKGIDELKKILERAGHKAVAIAHRESVSTALAASRYDIVIADYRDGDRVKKDLQAAGSHAEVLPIVYKPAKGVEAEVRRQYPFLIRPDAMSKYDALDEIDDLMKSRNRPPASLQ